MVNDINTNWESYIFKSVKINKGEYGNLYFGEHVFSLAYVLTAITKYFKDKTVLELKIFRHNDTSALAIKINKDYAIGIAQIVHKDEVRPAGVVIAKTEVVEKDDVISFEIVSKDYFPWENWRIIQKEEWKGREIKHYSYHSNYIFEQLEEEGDSLLI